MTGRAQLTVGAVQPPHFGPRAIDDAARCPAKAAVDIRGWGLPAGLPPAQCAPMRGGWRAATNLLKALSFKGPTSGYIAGTHPVTDLSRLADQALGDSSAVKRFAVAAVELLLDAQAATTSQPFDYVRDYMSLPFGAGDIHAGGVIAFAGPDGAWQLWRLRTKDAGPADKNAVAWALIAAHVLHGHLEAQQLPPARAVDVFECGAATGRHSRLAGWPTRDAVETAYAALARDRLRDAALALETAAGSHCAGCRFVGECSSARRVNGLLSGVPRQPHVVKITAGDLRSHADCPRRYQLLHDDGLPGEDLSGEAIDRGRLVDEWLTANHRRGVACAPADADRLRQATDDEVAVAAAGWHIGVCPLAEPSAADLAVQTDVVALDADSGVLLVARPDAVYSREGRVVWRETKTRAQLTGADARRLVETDVTAALYLVLLASGVCGPPEVLEWEELTSTRSDLTLLTADDADLLGAAREHVSGAVADVLADETHIPRPGSHCAGCAVRRWCPDAP